MGDCKPWEPRGLAGTCYMIWAALSEWKEGSKKMGVSGVGAVSDHVS